MIFLLENVIHLKKRKLQKDFSACKGFSEEFMNFENFVAALEELVHQVFHYAKSIFSFFISRALSSHMYCSSALFIPDNLFYFIPILTFLLTYLLVPCSETLSIL